MYIFQYAAIAVVALVWLLWGVAALRERRERIAAQRSTQRARKRLSRSEVTR